MTELSKSRPDLRARCNVFIPDFSTDSPTEEWGRLAAWSRSRRVEHDVYGAGGFVEEFEDHVAATLGKQSAVFMPSGVMAQLAALRIHAESRGLSRFGMHPTCHLALHEENAFSSLMRLEGIMLGELHRPLLASDLAACKESLSSAVVELPIREAGGVLPSWPELEGLKAVARQNGVTLHMDGARLWECAAWYGRSVAQIAEGFASVYVSTYKGLGGQAGAVLAGDEPFVAQARVWRRRMGGTLYRLGPLVAPAAMRFDERIAMMPALYDGAIQLAHALAVLPRLRVNPAAPQTNMLHLHFDADPRVLRAARDRVAEEDGVWLFGGSRVSGTPGWSVVEIYVGDNLLALEDRIVVHHFKRLVALLESLTV